MDGGRHPHSRHEKKDHDEELEEGSLREAASYCDTEEKNIHVGAAVMPDYLNSHYDPYASILNRGERGLSIFVCFVALHYCFAAAPGWLRTVLLLCSVYVMCMKKRASESGGRS